MTDDSRCGLRGDPIAGIRQIVGTRDTAFLGRSVSLATAMQILGISKRMVYYYIRDGKLATVRIGCSQRVLTESLDAWYRLDWPRRRS